MKRLLSLILCIGSILPTYALGDDTSQVKQVQFATTTIDSLAFRLEKLQHEFDYMYCDYEIYKLENDFKDLAQSIDISSNDILISIYNSQYDKIIYNLYLDNYTYSCDLFETLKERIDIVKTILYVKSLSSGFTDEEIIVLKSKISVINTTADKVQKALDYFDVVLKTYQKKRYTDLF